jgi:3',5'-cyclic AMP phosphodiesterase CpdA
VTRTLAHISDLHIGRDAQSDAAAVDLVQDLLEEEIDAVLLTGDITHRGRRAELAAFERIFSPLAAGLVLVPGNHDRMGEDAARTLMPGDRVQVELRPGLFLVRLDSTAGHNRRLLHSHGEVTRGDIAAVERALASAPPGALVVLMLHHHLQPLPEDDLGERIVSLLGWPNAAELDLGRDLLDRLRGRCDLVLHGHRHVSSEFVIESSSGRSLHVLSAGRTPALGRVRVISHAEGRIVAQGWLELARPSQLATALSRGRDRFVAFARGQQAPLGRA